MTSYVPCGEDWPPFADIHQMHHALQQRAAEET